MARAVNSPRFSVAGEVGPSPPDTGNKGSGVMTRFDTPTSKPSARTGDERRDNATTTTSIRMPDISTPRNNWLVRMPTRPLPTHRHFAVAIEAQGGHLRS